MVSDPKEYSHSPQQEKKNKLSYDPTPEELPLFEKLFQSCDVHNTKTSIMSDEAHALLSLSCLPLDVIKMIMSMTTNNGSHFLDRKQFFTAIRLVQLRQNRVSVRNLTLTVPSGTRLNPPYFKGLKAIESVTQLRSHADDRTNGDTNYDYNNSMSPCEKCFKLQKEIESLRQKLRVSELNEQKLKNENIRLKGREKNIESFLSAMDTSDVKSNGRKSISPHPNSIEQKEMEESLQYGKIRVDDFNLEEMHRPPNWTNRDDMYATSAKRTNLNSREMTGSLSNTIHGYPRRIRDFDMQMDKQITDHESPSMHSREDLLFDLPQGFGNHFDEQTPVLENIPKNLHVIRRRSSVVSDITSSMTLHPDARFFEELDEDMHDLGHEKKRSGKKLRNIFGQRTKSIKSLLTDWT